MSPQVVVACLNQKGGVGKSTIAQNLAAAAHLAGYRTALVDLDPQGTSADWFRVRAPTSRLCGLPVIHVNQSLGVHQLEDLTRQYEFVVYDGPARLADVCEAAAVAAHIVLCPMRVGIGEWWAAAQTQRMFDRADIRRADMRRVAVTRAYVLNEAKPHVAETTTMAEAIGAPLLGARIQSRVAFDRARARGESVLTTESDEKASAEILAVYHEILKIRANDEAPAS